MVRFRVGITLEKQSPDLQCPVRKGEERLAPLGFLFYRSSYYMGYDGITVVVAYDQVIKSYIRDLGASQGNEAKPRGSREIEVFISAAAVISRQGLSIQVEELGHAGNEDNPGRGKWRGVCVNYRVHGLGCKDFRRGHFHPDRVLARIGGGDVPLDVYRCQSADSRREAGIGRPACPAIHQDLSLHGTGTDGIDYDRCIADHISHIVRGGRELDRNTSYVQGGGQPGAHRDRDTGHTGYGVSQIIVPAYIEGQGKAALCSGPQGLGTLQAVQADRPGQCPGRAPGYGKADALRRFRFGAPGSVGSFLLYGGQGDAGGPGGHDV
ncbi:hypothetical protein ES705_42569 [subsurface metagenome]